VTIVLTWEPSFRSTITLCPLVAPFSSVHFSCSDAGAAHATKVRKQVTDTACRSLDINRGNEYLPFK
jgi:hypothetical protein